MCVSCRSSHLLVVCVAGTSDECGPAFRVELEGGDAVSSVTLSRDLWSQNLQTVPGRKACNDTPAVNSTCHCPECLLLCTNLLEEDGSCWSRSPDEEFQLIWTLMCLHLQNQREVRLLTASYKAGITTLTTWVAGQKDGFLPELRGVRRARSIR